MYDNNKVKSLSEEKAADLVKSDYSEFTPKQITFLACKFDKLGQYY